MHHNVLNGTLYLHKISTVELFQGDIKIHDNITSSWDLSTWFSSSTKAKIKPKSTKEAVL